MPEPVASTRPEGRERERRRLAAGPRIKWLLIAGGGVAAAIAVVTGVLAAAGVFGSSTGAAGDLSPGLARQLAGGGHSLGPAEAPVTVLEFADFQCPYCRAFWAGPLPQLEREFVDTGRVRLVFRHRIVVGTESLLAAEAAECAADQGQFFSYHDVLFQAQGPENSGYLTPVRLSGFAAQAGLDAAAFDHCLAAGTHRSDVSNASSEARAAGINSTPSVYVNGRRIANPFNWNALRAAILGASNGG